MYYFRLCFLKYFYTPLSVLLSPRIFCFRGQISKKIKDEVTIAKSHLSPVLQRVCFKCIGLRFIFVKLSYKCFKLRRVSTLINISYLIFPLHKLYVKVPLLKYFDFRCIVFHCKYFIYCFKFSKIFRRVALTGPECNLRDPYLLDRVLGFTFIGIRASWLAQ